MYAGCVHVDICKDWFHTRSSGNNFLINSFPLAFKEIDFIVMNLFIFFRKTEDVNCHALFTCIQDSA